MITQGDVDDRKPLEYKASIDFIYGKLFGDKGYIGKNLFQRFFVDGIQLITKLKSNMKGALMSVSDRLEKPLYFDPFGQIELLTLATIGLTLLAQIILTT